MSAVRPDSAELPFTPGDFVGRHAELRRVDELLACPNNRLITLVGPGGIGKTTLAAEIVRRQRAMPHRTAWVSRLGRLAHFAETETVAAEVLRTVGTTATADASPIAGLAAAFNGGNLSGLDRPILMLDNCEHVLPGVGALILDLLAAAPALTILATSREPVGWIDEHLVIVPPLAAEQAAELFRRRAERTGRAIPQDQQHREVIEGICRHVDHNPLFIRLAAARLRHRTPSKVLRELSGDTDDRRMRWPAGATVGVEQRHHSVRDVIAWSYGLCTEQEQLLLDRMSVFATGWERESDEILGAGTELDDIIAVCADRQLPRNRIGQLLERMTERSLVSVHLGPTAARYYLLESVAVFARERLARRRDELSERSLLIRLRRHYRDRIAAGPAVWYSTQEAEWLEWARCAWGNILLAIESSLDDPDEAAVGLEIAAVLLQLRVQFPANAYHLFTVLTERVLEVTGRSESPPARLRLTATALIAWVLIWQGRGERSARLLDACVAEFIDDPATRENWRADADADLGLPAAVEFTWGVELFLVQDSRSITVLSRAGGKFAEAGERSAAIRSKTFEMLAVASLSDSHRALTGTAGHLADVVAAEAGWAVSWAELARLIALSRHADPRAAVAMGRAALARHLDGSHSWTAAAITHFTTVAMANVLAKRAADPQEPRTRLVGAATELASLEGGLVTLWRSMGMATEEVAILAGGNRFVAEVGRSILGAHAYTVAAERGARLRPERDELRRFMLGELELHGDTGKEVTGQEVTVQVDGGQEGARRDGAGPGAARGAGRDGERGEQRWRELSPAEADIAVLAAAGWPNSAISARRGSSIRTVDGQVASVLRKLRCANRVEITRHVPVELRERVTRETGRRRGSGEQGR
ncbi:helix-turn-helix transcriptional regulator [Nocardia callitridis]|uniref:HTH luxR-type domain-containing protein n=1 Tax=Nocardia callitridis TaxID=648753 RepID=A0ABP9KEM8_9NOCA